MGVALALVEATKGLPQQVLWSSALRWNRAPEAAGGEEFLVTEAENLEDRLSRCSNSSIYRDSMAQSFKMTVRKEEPKREKMQYTGCGRSLGPLIHHQVCQTHRSTRKGGQYNVVPDHAELFCAPMPTLAAHQVHPIHPPRALAHGQ